MDNLYWGQQQGNKKRKFDEYYDCDYDNDIQINNSKKIKLFKRPEKMIYSIGNEIHFTAPVNKLTMEQLIKKFTKVINKNKDKYDNNSKEKLEITYIVDSPGGCVSSGLKFMDFMRLTKKKYPYITFTSIITGLAASMGSLMTVCADKRLITKSSFAMIHQLSSGSSGKYQELMSYSDHLKTVHELLLDIYEENNKKKTRDELEDLLANETWFSAQQYFEAGFVDEIC